MPIIYINNDDIRLNSSSSDKVVVYGKLGIGTTSPDSKLHINSGANLNSFVKISTTTDAYASGITLRQSSNYGFDIYYDDDGVSPSNRGLYFDRVNLGTAVNSMFIERTSGNVGIGTTTPGYKLQVAGNARIDSNLYINNSNGTAIVNAYSGGSIGTYLAKASSATANFTTTGVSYPRGLGFGAIIGQGNTTDIPVNNSSWNGGYGGLIGFWSDLDYGAEGGTNAVGYNAVIKGTGNGNSYGFFADLSGATDGTRYGIYTKGEQYNYFSGNVGIGTTGPQAKLHVAGSVRVTGTYLDVDANAIITGNYYGNSSNEYTYLKMYNGSDASINIGTKHALSYISFESGNGAYTERMRITNTGNVGIGTTSPTTKLNVSGNIAIPSGSYLSFIDSNLTYNTIKRSTSVGGIQIDTGGSASVNILDNGNVGIGTTSPATRLHVSKTDLSNELVAVRVQNDTNYSEFGTQSGYARILSGGYLLYAGSSNSTYFYNSGNVVMTTNYLGNVGIGTSSPSTKLDVIGTGVFGTMTTSRGSYSNGLSLQNNGGQATSLFLWQNGVASAHIGSPANSTSLHIVNSYNTGSITDPNAIVLTNTGNVGIGTTSPTGKLHVYSGLAHNNVYVNTGASGGTGYDVNLYLNGGANNSEMSINMGIVGNEDRDRIRTYQGNMYFRTNDSENMIINSSGNVGIGTTNPLQTLHVSGQRILVDASNAGIMFRTGGVNRYSVASVDGDFQVYDEVNGLNRFYITSAGNVGIGTTSPGAKLHVDDSSADAVIRLSKGSSTIGNIDFVNEGNRFSIQDDGSRRLVIDTDGNVGINTTSPSAKLDVVGDARFQYADSSTTLSSGGSILRLANNDTTVDNISAIDFPQSTAGSGFSRIGVIYKDRTASSEDQDMFFRTIGSGSSSEVMRLTSDGNVGIGTTSPGEKLSVNGFSYAYGAQNVSGFKYENTTAGHVVIMNANDSYAQLYTTGATPLMLGTNNSVRAYITSDGNVGIGTTSPAYKLDVSGAVKSSVGFLASVAETTDADSLFNNGFRYGFLYNSATNKPVAGNSHYANLGNIVLTHYDGASTNDFYIRAKSYNGNTSWGKILTDQNTTLGTAASSAATDFVAVTGDTMTGGLTITDASVGLNIDSTGHASLRVDRGSTSHDNNLLFYTAGNLKWRLWMDGSDDYLYIRDEAGQSNIVTFKIGGNVGIGTTSPDSKFHVEDTNPEVRITGTGGTSFPRILWEYPVSATQASRWALTSSASGNTFYLYNYTQSKKVFQVDGTASHITLNHDAAGTTQIGTSTTQTAYQLYVATNVGQTGAIEAVGSVKITSGALGVNIAASATAGRIDASNDIVAYSTSDKRLKGNIKPIENALDKVKSLTGVEFDWIEETKHVHGYEGHDVGVIAQEVQEVLPEAIRTNDSGYLSVRYEKMIALLVEANKELAARVELLEQKLKQ